MYRPTLRCSDVYKKYLDSLSDVTGLDRNQLIRLALFSAPFSKLFIAQLEQKAGDVTLPHPTWEVFNHELWMEQDPKLGERGDDVNVKSTGTEETKNVVGNPQSRRESEQNEQYRRQQQEQRRTREIYNGTGGIRIRIG